MGAPRPAGPPPPPPRAGGKGGGAAVEERRRKLREYLAAKRGLERPSAKSYLKDKTNRPDRISSKPDPAIRCQISSISRNAQLRKSKWAVPADQVLLGKRTACPVSSKPPAKIQSRSSAVSSTKRHSCHLRKSGKQELVAAPRTVSSLANWSCQLKNRQGNVECEKSSGAKTGLQLQQRLSHKAKSQGSSKQPSKKSRLTVGSKHDPGKCQAWTDQTARSQVQGGPREPRTVIKQPAGHQKRVPRISVVRTPAQLGQSSAVSRPVVKGQGQLPRAIKQSMVNPQAVDAVGRGEPFPGKENTAPSALNIPQREQSKRQAKARQALHERMHPTHSVGLRRKPKLTPGSSRAAACGVISWNRSTAERDQHSRTPKQAPKTVASQSGHTASAYYRANAVAGSRRCGGYTPKSRPLTMGAGQAPRTPCRQDRRKQAEPGRSLQAFADPQFLSRLSQPPTMALLVQHVGLNSWRVPHKPWAHCQEPGFCAAAKQTGVQEAESQGIRRIFHPKQIPHTSLKSYELTPGQVLNWELLEQWLASRGKSYKRPPVTMSARKPQKEKENRDLSWNCTEEEKGEEREQLGLASKLTSILAECLKLAEEGFSSEELLAMLSRIPEVKKCAQFWICKARLLAQQGTFDVAGLYEAAVSAGAAPLQDLRNVIAGILNNTSKTAPAIPAEASPFSKTSPRRAMQGPAPKPLSAVKLQVVPLLRAKEPSVRPDMKLVTPVRRSLRIERALACYPPMLKDHDPVVSSLEDILESGSQFVFRNNAALPEEVELAGLVAELHSRREKATQHPEHVAMPPRNRT